MTKEELLDYLEPFEDDSQVMLSQPDGHVPIRTVDSRDGNPILTPANAWRWDKRRAG